MKIPGWLCVIFMPALAGLAKTNDLQERLTPVPADQPIPVEDFFRPWLFGRPRINPSGTHFASLVSTQNDRTDLMTFELSTKKVERLSGGEGFDVYDYRWVGDRRLLYWLRSEKRYATGLFAVNLGRFGDAYALMRDSVTVPVGFPKDSPRQAIIWEKFSAQVRGQDGGVAKIDTEEVIKPRDRSNSRGIDDGTRVRIVKSYPTPQGGVPLYYEADSAGELAFAVTAKDGVYGLHRYVDGGWVRCPVNLDDVSLVGGGEAPGEIFVCVPNHEGKPWAMHRMDASSGVVGERFFQDEKYDIKEAKLYRHPVDHRVLGIQYDRRGPQSVWFDASYASVQKLLEQSLPKKSVEIMGSDRDQKQFFFSAFSDVSPPTYYVFNFETETVTPVIEVAPWIDSKRMRPMRSITYSTRDGREIEGYVTLPEGASKEKPAPLIVLAHGGPWARDDWGWHAEVQFLASRGYAVFQPNYRGSTGYTWRFTDEDLWAFRKMHEDVTDGVKTVLKTGVIDPGRLAIMGGSFGGYLALSGAAHEPGLYRCAVTIAGVFDWELAMKDWKDGEYSDFMRGGFGQLRRKLGDPALNKAKFEEISPIKHVAKIRIPIFVAHGTSDPVASVAQSKTLIAELKKNGVAYEKQIERGEGHGFQKLDNQVELYTAIEAFLTKNMAPRNAPAAVAGSPVTTK